MTTALDAAQRSGNRRGYSVATAIRGIHSAWQGNFDRAEADARAALQSAMASGSRAGVRGAMIPLVWSLTGRGAYEEIEAELAAHGLEHAAGTSIVIAGNLLVARANLRRCEGRFAKARDDILHVIELMPTFNPLGRVSVWAPRMLAVTGHREQAVELADRAVTAARGARLHGSLGIALHSAGLAELGDRSVEYLREAAHVLEASPWRWEHAETLVDLGAALRRANHRKEARLPLREGYELAQRIGALALAERAREELIAAGARPRRPMRTGADALTASERRVATMAAEGSSISEVAQALFVTRKTVETHLYAAYRKLDVNSREALATVLAREPNAQFSASRRPA